MTRTRAVILSLWMLAIVIDLPRALPGYDMVPVKFREARADQWQADFAGQDIPDDKIDDGIPIGPPTAMYARKQEIDEDGLVTQLLPLGISILFLFIVAESWFEPDPVKSDSLRSQPPIRG